MKFSYSFALDAGCPRDCRSMTDAVQAGTTGALRSRIAPCVSPGKEAPQNRSRLSLDHSTGIIQRVGMSGIFYVRLAQWDRAEVSNDKRRLYVMPMESRRQSLSGCRAVNKKTELVVRVHHRTPNL